MAFNSLPNYKSFDWSKFKAFADDKIKVIESLKIVLGKVENIVGRGENAAFSRLLKVEIKWERVKLDNLIIVSFG